jgi:hypothetical protein
MTREEFLLEMDEILGLRAGTLRGDETLDEVQNWDSTALVGLIVLAEEANDTCISQLPISYVWLRWTVALPESQIAHKQRKTVSAQLARRPRHAHTSTSDYP